MLPKQFRLTAQRFYQNQNPPQKIHSTSLILLSKKTTNNAPCFAIIVPKKLNKRSTLRNQTKRVISAAIAHQLGRAKTNTEVLLRAKRILAKKELQETTREVQLLFQKAGIV